MVTLELELMWLAEFKETMPGGTAVFILSIGGSMPGNALFGCELVVGIATVLRDEFVKFRWELGNGNTTPLPPEIAGVIELIGW